MKINHFNYEIFFLDYLDGKLSDAQIDEFIDFLKINPNLRDELEAIKDIELPDVEVPFPWKDKLLKKENEDRSFDYRAIAFMEGNLSDEAQKSFVEELDSDPGKEKELDLILSTKLKKEEIHYPFKNKLYRKSRVKRLHFAFRVAAILILLFAVWNVLQLNQVKIDEPPMLTESSTPLMESNKNKIERKREPVAKKKPVEKINEAKTDSIPEKKKSIRERTKGRLKEYTKNDQDNHISTPERIAPIVASLIPAPNFDTYALEEMPIRTIPQMPEYISIDRFLAQKLFNAKNNSKENFTQKSLKAVSGWSNKKLAYETDDQGKVAEISVNTGLLAFSIPLSKNK